MMKKEEDGYYQAKLDKLEKKKQRIEQFNKKYQGNYEELAAMFESLRQIENTSYIRRIDEM